MYSIHDCTCTYVSYFIVTLTVVCDRYTVEPPLKETSNKGNLSIMNRITCPKTSLSYSANIFITSEERKPLYNEQNNLSRYSEVPLYTYRTYNIMCLLAYTSCVVVSPCRLCGCAAVLPPVLSGCLLSKLPRPLPHHGQHAWPHRPPRGGFPPCQRQQKQLEERMM